MTLAEGNMFTITEFLFEQVERENKVQRRKNNERTIANLIYNNLQHRFIGIKPWLP